ncbi:MAG TPA: TMEM43 family protein [Myxococcota bacterium]|nr:TMEM43 family protein [Myxococcota bacterium]
MVDKITKVTEKGFFSTLGESIKKVLAGLALFFLAFPLLLFNECRSVQTAKSLDEGSGLVVEVDSASVDPGNQGKLVHISGEAKTVETLKDPVLAVEAKGLRLERSVEMYQWLEREEKKTKDGKEYTTFYYEKGWSPNLVDYTDFEEQNGHVNPASMPFTTESWAVSRATVGAWQMSADQILKLSNWEGVAVSDDMAAAGGGKAHNGMLYIGPDPATPTIGDTRIEYEAVPEGPVSLVGRQTSSTMEAYQTEAGDKLLLVRSGVMSAEAMFQAAHDDNVLLTWILRFVGFLMMFVGLGLLFGPVKVIADRVPFFGPAISGGVGLFAFLLAAFLSLFTIAVSWIVARPLVGVLLLIASLGAFAGVIMLVRRAKGAAAAA